MKKGLVLVLTVFMVMVVSGLVFAGGKPYVPSGFVPKGWNPNDSDVPVLNGPISPGKMLTLGMKPDILEEDLLAVVYNGKDSKGIEKWKIETLPKGTEIIVKKGGYGNFVARYKRKCGNIFFPHDEGFKKDPRLPASNEDVERIVENKLNGMEGRIMARMDKVEREVRDVGNDAKEMKADFMVKLDKLLNHDNGLFALLVVLLILGIITLILIIGRCRPAPAAPAPATGQGTGGGRSPGGRVRGSQARQS